MRKSPAFTLVAVASLAIGIGFNAALFAIVDAVLFRPLPVAEPDRLVDVFTSGAPSASTERYGTTSYPDYLDLRAQNDVFEDLVGYSPMFGPLNLDGRSRLVLGEAVTGNYFKVFGVGAEVGRPLQPDDDRPGAPHVAMISHQFWTREFAGSPTVIGQTIKLRGDPYTIVGVAPREFNGMIPVLSPELWITVASSLVVEPFGMRDVVPSPSGTTRLDRRGERWLFARGRLKPGRTVAEAGANVELLMSRLAAAYPATNKDRHVAVKATNSVHLHPSLDTDVVPMAAGLMTVVGLVLLIACANVASMLLARASGRQKEIGVRLAIGATRGRLARQLVTESVVMSTIGAAAGIVLAWWITRVVTALPLPSPIPLAFDVRIDGRVLAFTTIVTLAAGVLAGLAPAFKASKPDLVTELRGESFAPPGRVLRWTMRDVLVVAQIAVTAVLLVVAALLTRSLVASERAAIGFAADHLAVLSTDTSMAGYSPDRSLRFYDEAQAAVRRIPGVQSVALATRVPFSVNTNRWEIWITGRHDAATPPDVIDVTRVSPTYFDTIGVAIVEGRDFSDADRPDTPRVAIVNETMARKYWPGQSAVGKTFHTRNAQGPLFEIVGVTADHKVTTVGEPPTPFIQAARSQQPNSYSFVVARTRGDAASLLRDMRRALLALEPNLVFVEAQTMEAEVATTLFPVRVGATLVTVVGMVAMLLAAIGLYGVIAYSVARKTREIAIRMALGARPAHVLGQVMRHGFAVTSVGVGLGCLIAAGAAALTAHLSADALYGVGLADPVSWGVATVLLVGVSSLANFIPAWRASRVQPSVALRTE